MKKKIILIADDDENDAEFIMRNLSFLSHTCEFIHLNDGVEVLDFLRKKGIYSDRADVFPVLIIMDKKMPRKDGIETLREIRNDPVIRNVPVIIFSSSNYDKDIADSYDSGVNAYIVKPINIDQFSKVVEQIGEFWIGINEAPLQVNRP